MRIIKSGKPEEVEKMSPVFEKVYNDSKLKGIREGEKNKSLEIATNMLVEGCDVDFVVKVTKLDLIEVRMIQIFEKIINDRTLEGKMEGERNKGLEIARNMLVEGCEVDFVAKVTKLPLDEVRGLKRELAN